MGQGRAANSINRARRRNTSTSRSTMPNGSPCFLLGRSRQSRRATTSSWNEVSAPRPLAVPPSSQSLDANQGQYYIQRRNAKSCTPRKKSTEKQPFAMPRAVLRSTSHWQFHIYFSAQAENKSCCGSFLTAVSRYHHAVKKTPKKWPPQTLRKVHKTTQNAPACWTL